MIGQYEPIADLLLRVRARWRRLVALQLTARAALTATGVLAAAVVLARWLPLPPAALAALAILGAGLVLAAVVWSFAPLRRVPADRRIARFIEERATGLDERLVSAVDVATAPSSIAPPLLAASMVSDAARAASSIDPADIVPRDSIRQAGLRAVAAVAALVLVAVVSRGVIRESIDAIVVALFPSHVGLEVSPGNARIEAGSTLTVEAWLVGNSAPVTVQLVRGDGVTDMVKQPNGHFMLALNALAKSFEYRVVAGAVTSGTYSVSVVRAPRAQRIDVEYTYPAALRLPPRIEQDGGDIYAPAGTSVRLVVHPDVPAASGSLNLGGDKTIPLTPGSEGLLYGALHVSGDDSYRVALADSEGLSSAGDTEYFIRTLEDRPPDVHVVKPASDRRVTPLEEVALEAEAGDDFGVESLDLVYSVRGGPERVVRMPIAPGKPTATARHTLYLEDLNVKPGDFLSYYVRARDMARGKRSSETRSDMFFLDVKPFEGEFTLAQSQAAMGGGQSSQELDDLVAAQKQIIVATWKLDRRSQAARGATSAEDIRSVSRAEAELRTRVEQASSAFRQSNMRDPRAPRGRGVVPGGAPPGGLQAMTEEDAMSAAAAAMAKAVAALDALKTGAAVAPEMDALNHLLKAQGDVRRRQVSQQAAGAGGGNRPGEDMSSLFDKELARRQATNYETPQGAATEDESKETALDKIKELARRQDELLKRQQALGQDREQMTEQALKRELERLARDQNELQQRADEIARQMAQQQNRAGQAGQQQQQAGRAGQQQGQAGQEGQKGQAGAAGQAGQREMRAVSEQMRGATSDLRRQDAEQASQRAARALEALREVERQLQESSPDGRRRALGDLRLEMRQLADAERRIAAETGRAPQGEAGSDALRRLAGEQERMAERLTRAQQGLARAAGSPGAQASSASDEQQAAANAARELDRLRVAERMQASAEAMRSAAGQSGGNGPRDLRSVPGTQQEIARALDRLADQLAAAGRPGDDESRKASEHLAQARALRERLDDLSRQLERLNQESSSPSRGGNNGRQGQGQNGSTGSNPDVARLQDQMNRDLRELASLMNELRQQEASNSRNGVGGRTFEGQGMTLSDPGTQAFKQDFAKWEELKRQASAALDQAETALTKKLQERDAKDRLASGADDAAPAAYQEQVDSYFKALATRKKQ